MSENLERGSEAPTQRGRPRAHPAAEPARLIQLSPATQLVVSKRAAMFVRGRQAFTLSDRELRMLTLALAEEEKP